MKRLTAYLFYDSEGIVDDYVIYALEKFMEVSDKLAFICNGEINPDCKNKVSHYCTEFFQRANIGYDAGAWKELFGKMLKWEELSEYDEIILINDSCYGPLFPLHEMLDEMEQKPVDFWGLTMHGRTKDTYKKSKLGYFPEHIQTYMVAIREKMHSSDAFKTYWDRLDFTKDIEEAICLFETPFTKYFEDMGFKWDTYTDTRYIIREDKETSENPYSYIMNDLLKQQRCPFIKRKPLLGMLNAQFAYGYPTILKECIDYIDLNTEYDVNLIKKHLLRKGNIRNFYEQFCLDYVLPENYSTNLVNDKKTALFAHIVDEKNLKSYCSYIKSMPNNSDLYITTNSDDKRDSIKEYLADFSCNRINISNTGADRYSLQLLINYSSDIINSYDYICCIHDDEFPLETRHRANEFNYKMVFESLLKSRDYVQNIIDTFESEPLMGVATHTKYYAGRYIRSMGNRWEKTYETAKKIIDSCDLKARISKDIAPMTFTGCFWCRPEVLVKLVDYCKDNSIDWGTSVDEYRMYAKTVERTIGYFAQDCGKYSVAVLPCCQASIVISNYGYMLRGLISQIWQLKGVKSGKFPQMYGTLKRKVKREKRLVSVKLEVNTDRIKKKLFERSKNGEN